MTENSPFAFVLMPFDHSFDDIYKFGIKAPAEEAGILAQRVDEQLYKEGMLDRIYNQIELADMVIADMTGRNPNVFYEVGYAHAKNKLCVLLTSDSDDIPFDLKHRRHIVYRGSIAELKSQIVQELEWAKKEIDNIKGKNIQVTLKRCTGILKKSKYSATGVVDFEIDLNNHSSEVSSEIEMAYFYSTKAWQLDINGKGCPSSASDIPGYETRHFLEAPARRLRPGGWAQLRFRATKTLATTFDGDELKDEYPITGRANVRLVTSDGNADYEVNVDAVAEEFPF